MPRFLLLILFITSLSHLQGQVLWERTWGNNYDDATELRALPDTGLIFLSSIQTIDSWLVRTDVLGDTLWTRRINWADFYTVRPTSDGGFFLGGTTRSGLRNEVAFKVDQNGDSLWAHIYPDSFDHGVYTSLILPDSGILLTGYSNRNNYDMWARALNPDGTTRWTATYGSPAMEFGAMPALCPDSGFLFATTQGGTIPQLYLTRTDPQGQVQWTRTISPGLPAGGAVPTPLPDGGFLVISWIQLPGNNYDSYLLRLNSLGDTLWTRHYGGLGFEERAASGILIDALGGYTYSTMVDLTFGPGFDRDILINRLDTAGTIRQQIRVGRREDDVPRYLVQTADNGYAVVGYTRSFHPTAYQVYLSKLGAFGCDMRFYWPGFPERDTLCPQDTLALDAGLGFVKYEWSNGDTTRFTYLTAPDTICVTATDAGGCVHYSNFFRGTAQPGPSFTWTSPAPLQIAFDGDTLGQWNFGDATILQSDDPIHTYTQAGTYQVCLSRLIPGCDTVVFCDSITVTGPLQTISPLPSQVTIAPHPAHDWTEIHWQGQRGFVATLYDLTGRPVATALTEKEKLRLPLVHLPGGTYSLLLRSLHDQTWTGRLTKQ